MNYRKIGNTDISVSEISMGCWTLGGLYFLNGISAGWDTVDEGEAIKAIHLAIDKGVNHFDNADVYGVGVSERMLAKALGNKNKDVIIATKVGHFPGTAEHAYDPMHIRHQCEQSLKNLNRDFVDIFYFHHGDFGENDKYLDEAVMTVNRLKEEGKIRIIGQSAYSSNDFLKLVPIVKPDVLQGSASILNDQFIRQGMPVRKLMDDGNLSIVTFSPLSQGRLLGKYSAKNPPIFKDGDNRKDKDSFSKKTFEKIDPKIEELKNKFGSSEIKDLSRVALQFLLHHPVVACTIPGFRNSNQVEINLSGMDSPLTDEEFKFVQKTFRD